MTTSPDWHQRGVEFGNRAVDDYGMFALDDDTDIKTLMMGNMVAIEPHIKGLTATCYGFSDEENLYIIVHHYNHVVPKENGFTLAGYPLKRINRLCHREIQKIVDLTIAFLGLNPAETELRVRDEDWLRRGQ